MAAIGVAAAALLAAGSLGPIVTISVARHRAAVAADAAALAAAAGTAGLVEVPDGDPCALAAELAARHGAALRACRVDGLEATVEVEIATALGPVAARASAGPPPAG